MLFRSKPQEKAKEDKKEEAKPQEKVKEDKKEEAKPQEKVKEDKKEETKPQEKPKENKKEETKPQEKAKEDKKEEIKPQEKAEEDKKEEAKPQEKPEKEKNVETKKQLRLYKTKIVLDIFANKIKIDGEEDLFYKVEEKRKKELMKRYNIKSLLKFQTIKKEIKNINYGLISALEKIDDEKSTLVYAYLDVKAGKIDPEKAKEGMKTLDKYVDIDYIFNKSIGNIKAKNSARNDNELGIASVYGIKNGVFHKIWEKSREILNRSKNLFSNINKKLFQRKENPKALGQRSEATRKILKDNVNKNNENEEIGKTKNSEAQKFRKEVESSNKVKKSTENISKQYKERENKREKIHKLTENEYEEIKSEKLSGGIEK